MSICFINCKHSNGAGLRGGGGSEAIEGLLVLFAGEEFLQSSEEELVVTSGLGEQGHAGVKFEVVRETEDLGGGAVFDGIDELRALAQASAQNLMLGVGFGFRAGRDG